MADAKPKASDTLQGTLMDAAQAITRAMGTPEAADPKVAAVLGKLQTAVLGIARGPSAPMQGAAPGGSPGGPPGAGMGPPGGGAANPAMPAMTGGQPSAPPGAGATMAVPQMPPDELRRMIAQGT